MRVSGQSNASIISRDLKLSRCDRWRALLAHAHAIFPPLFFFIVEAPLFRSGDGGRGIGGGVTWRALLAHAHPIFPPLSSAVEAPLFRQWRWRWWWRYQV